MEPLLPIHIDLSEVAEAMKLQVQQCYALDEFVLDRVTERYGKLWEDEVKHNLRSTRGDYLRAMSYQRLSFQSAEFTLHYSEENPVPIMIEVGTSPFDIKEGFRTSLKSKDKKDGGWYLTVPFRLATSEALAEDPAFSGKMPKEIEQAVKKFGRLTPENIPLDLSTPGQRAVIDRMGRQVQEYKHKFSIYAGLQRVDISSTNREKRSGYMTFRRVSDKSDPQSWWHRGFEKHDFMGKAFQKLDIGKVVDMAIDKFFEK